VASEPQSRTHALRACAAPQCLERVHELLAALWADAPGVGAEDRIGFETAVAEVAANIVEHSGAGPDMRVGLNLQVRAYADRVEALFCDTGVEADVDIGSAALPDDMAESGRGLAIARAAVDEVVYERDGGVNRWRVTRLLG
jgi:anti-sigma regulatory factor (Ser/Thr protein kinase)